MRTRTFSRRIPPRVLDRQTAWGCALTNLVLPGLGTWAAGRRVAGIAQLVVSQGGFISAMVWAVWLVRVWMRTGQLPTELGPYFWPAMAGVALFFVGWLWSLGSGLQLLWAARQQRPEVKRPDQ